MTTPRVRFMGKHPVFGRVKRTRSPDGSIKKTETGVPYNRSPYYLWWRALRLSNAYKAVCESKGKTEDSKLADIYRDFGDIFAQDFEPWWRRKGAELFGEPTAPLSVVTVEIDQVAAFKEAVSAKQLLVVAIPLFLTKREIASKVRRLVAKHHKGKRGNNSIQTRESLTKAKYKLHRYKSIDAIRRWLDVREGRLQGKSLRALFPLSGHFEIQQVSRDDKQARTIIQNVERGRFPVTKG
jgi:hypothetical protein